MQGAVGELKLTSKSLPSALCSSDLGFKGAWKVATGSVQGAFMELELTSMGEDT